MDYERKFLSAPYFRTGHRPTLNGRHHQVRPRPINGQRLHPAASQQHDKSAKNATKKNKKTTRPEVAAWVFVGMAVGPWHTIAALPSWNIRKLDDPNRYFSEAIDCAQSVIVESSGREKLLFFFNDHYNYDPVTTCLMATAARGPRAWQLDGRYFIGWDERQVDIISCVKYEVWVYNRFVEPFFHSLPVSGDDVRHLIV